MPVPLQITFRNLTPSTAVRQRIEEHAEKLERLHPRIVSCKVVVGSPHRHQQKGRLFDISIDLKVPGREIVVNRDSSEQQAHRDVYVAIHDAFDVLERQLEEAARRRRGEVKTHEAAGPEAAAPTKRRRAAG